MKKFLLGLILFFATLSHAAIKDQDSQYIAPKNYAKNPGFEEALSKWTASGGTLAQVTSGSNLLTGAGSATWDSSSASQTLSNSAMTVTNALKGKAGEAYCTILTPSGTATHLLQVYDGSNPIASVTVFSSTSPRVAKVPFTFPTSGTVSLRLISVNANEPLIAIDDCYMGPLSTPAQLTEAERDAITSPIKGLTIFNTTTNSLNFYNGTSWEVMGNKSGRVVQIVFEQIQGLATYSSYTPIPEDTSAPQNTEGAQVMTATITPTDAANYLLIETMVWIGETTNTINRYMFALFRDSTAGALAAGIITEQDGQYAIIGGYMKIKVRVTAGSTSATTFKLRAGDAGGTAFNINGWQNSQVLNVITSSMTITEIKP